ncbi:MAG TPA: hypothetical protein VHT49_15530, partial [Acidimicrobiales bacterium]|nr:hypothetical protein [Acidimicrobiales bacterium]
MAIGSYLATTPDPNVSTNQGSITLLSGTDVTGIQAPLPGDAAVEPEVNMNSVSCSQPGSCVIVGSYFDGNGQEQGLIDTLSLGAWSSQQAPAPPDISQETDRHYINLTDVKCDLTGDCVAIGLYNDSVPVTRGVIESETGGVWGETEAPVPPDAYAGPNPNYLNNELTDLSCPTISSCVAAGAYAQTEAPSFGQFGPQYGMFVDSLTGGTWVASEVPLPPDSAVGIGLDISFGEWVSCAAPGQCGATGGYFNNAAQTNERGVVATLDGGTWTSIAAPVPGNVTASPISRASMTSISCAAAGACVAVGFYQTNLFASSGAPADQSVIDTLTGGVWTPSEAPPPTSDTSD